VRDRGEEDLLDDRSTGRGRPFLVLFAVWLVYLVDPLLAAWRIRDTARGVVGLLAVLAFAVLYVVHFALVRAGGFEQVGPGATRASRAAGLLRYAGLVLLVVVATLALGQPATATWVFLAVTGMWTFPLWPSFALALGYAALYEVLAYTLPSWHRDNGLSISILLSMLAVTGVMMAVRRSRDLSEARRENARLAVQEERNRVARDLHDILGHSLTVIRVKAELAARMVDIDPARARAEVEEVEALAREALADVRGAVEGFREISLSGELARAREALGSAGIEARLPRHVDTVDPALRELYAWTVREGVTNVIRHSGARVCTVDIDARGLRLADDGRVGMPGPAGRADGHGLQGLAERARSAGATVSARRLEPRGFELVVSASAGGGEA
jgi:two-component system sensor histidine kinase DesK